MSYISTEERRQRWEKLESVRSGTNNIQSHPKGFNVKGKKRQVEVLDLNSPNVKAHRLKERNFPASGKEITQAPSIDKASVTFWSDIGFDTL